MDIIENAVVALEKLSPRFQTFTLQTGGMVSCPDFEVGVLYEKGSESDLWRSASPMASCSFVNSVFQILL